MEPTPTHHHRDERRGLLDAPPKTTFVLGLLTGLVTMAIAAIAVLIPLASKARNGSTGTTTGTVTNDTNATAPTAQPSQPVSLKPVGTTDHVQGPSNAAITIVEYSDMQCPYCGNFHPTLLRLMSEYPTQLRWVYRHFPLTTLHPQAQPAAEASECAAAQNKFWEFADKLFANQQSLSATYYPEVAKGLGLNMTKFNDCLTKGDGRAKIAADVADATSIGVNGTPTSFLNGTEIAGAQPYETIKAQIDAILARK